MTRSRTRGLRLVLSVAASLGLLSAYAGPPAPDPFRMPTGDTCTVHSASDGDTLRCRDGRRIRLIGVDAPETAQGDFGTHARAGLLRIARVSSSLHVETDVVTTDRYGRTLAYLWTSGGTLVNQAVADSGLAVALVIPPNVRYAGRIRSAVARARAARRGLWATPAFDCRPRDFRAGRCS
jgi:micrococcal nuclease